MDIRNIFYGTSTKIRELFLENYKLHTKNLRTKVAEISSPQSPKFLYYFCMISCLIISCSISVAQSNTLYSYDNNNRLILARNSSNCSKTTYSYDADGNRQVQYTAISVTPQITNNYCYGGTLGSISLSSANSSLSYNWSTGANGSSISNLISGNYTVTIQDAANSNTCIKTYKIKQPQQPPVHLQTTHLICYGYHNATATIDTTGASLGSIVVTWPNGSHGLSTNSLSAGNQYLSIGVVSAGCIVRDSFTISQPSSNIDTVLTDPVTCYGRNDGFAYIKVQGNASLYTFAWPDSLLGQSQSNLYSGIYSVTVTDTQTSCVQSVNISIPQPSQISISPTIVPTCINNMNGSISISATGGMPPYQYSVNGAGYQDANTFNNLDSGRYSIAVRDANYCERTFTNITVGVILCNTGVTSIQESIYFNVYPSPNNGEFFVSFSTADAQDYTIEVYDLSGKKIKSISGYSSGQLQTICIDLDSPASGQYIVNLVSRSQTARQQIEVMN